MSDLWVWVPGLTESGPVALSQEETRHVVARRLRVGEPLVAFDGNGRHAIARLESLEKRAALIDVGPIREEVRPEVWPVLASAIPKGDRLGTMLQMLTQLGAEVWQPLLLEDSAVRKLDPLAPRLNRILIESAKVARRVWHLEILPPISLEALLAQQPEAAQIVFGDREASSSGLSSTVALVVIGPEAGFSEPERETLEKVRANATSFSANNLRIETAVVAAAAGFNVCSGRPLGVG